MDYGNVPKYESSRFSFCNWVYTVKTPKSFMMRLAKQFIMFIQHKTFWSSHHLVKIFNSKISTRAFFRVGIQVSIE